MHRLDRRSHSSSAAVPDPFAPLHMDSNNAETLSTRNQGRVLFTRHTLCLLKRTKMDEKRGVKRDASRLSARLS